MNELNAAARALLRWWWLIVIPTLLATLAALPALSTITISTSGYSTVLHFSAAHQSADPPAESDLLDVWQSSELAVHALGAWIRTESFRREVLAAPGVESADLQALAIASDNYRSIGQLFLSHPDAQALARVAAGAVQVLQTRGSDYLPQFGDGKVAVTVLDAPAIVPAAVPLSQRLSPLIRIALGFGMGLLLTVLAQVLDPCLRSRSEVEGLGLAVLAALPKD